MMKMWWYHQVYRRKTLSDVINEHGKDWLFEDSGVDAATIDLICEHFELNFTCDQNDEKFKFYLRRRLRQKYPIYLEQLKAWEHYQDIGYFVDTSSDNKTTYTGKTTSLQNTDSVTLSDTNTSGESNTDNTKDTTTHTEGNYTDFSDTSEYNMDTTDSETNSKDRVFNFAYPESNYTGGVIPYNIDDNPSVEFIDRQTDSIHKDTTHSESDGNRQSDTSQNGDSSSDGTVGEKGNSKTNTTGASETNVNVDITQLGEGTNDYTIEYSGKGLHYVDVYEKLRRLIPTTDFYQQFMYSLRRLFDTYETTDELYNDIYL